MSLETILLYCLKKDFAVLEYPFEESLTRFTVGTRTFAEIVSAKDSDPVLSLRGTPEVLSSFRKRYPHIIALGKYRSKTRQGWIHFPLGGGLPEQEIFSFLDSSYWKTVSLLSQTYRIHSQARNHLAETSNSEPN